ncbi:MAG: hypothetical protein HUU55_17240 [Myxococcales bacterium]|nr:hypothetical protein [Myxococcales bacterium]
MEQTNGHPQINEPEHGEGSDFQIPFDPAEPGSVQVAAEQLRKRFGLGYTPTLCYDDRMRHGGGILVRRIRSLFVGY